MKEEAKMKKTRKSSKKGFTLVELIVVLVILAILAAMLVPALTGYIKRARQEKDYQMAASVLLPVLMVNSGSGFTVTVSVSEALEQPCSSVTFTTYLPASVARRVEAVAPSIATLLCFHA